MVKPLNELKKNIKPDVRRVARAEAVQIVAEMSLAETRKARGKSQAAVAQTLGVAQPNISQIENRPDAMVSTLREYIEALGGKLEIHARFPDGQDIELTQFR